MNRLRDNPNEVYQFRERIPFDADDDPSGPFPGRKTSKPSPTQLPYPMNGVRTSSDSPEDDYLPNGVFTLLTECYSPTCTRDKLCYSIACPRRLEQIARLNLKIQTGLKSAQIAAEESDDRVDIGVSGERRLWINTVPRDISDALSEKEKKRQENINEVIYTERDFVKDIEYLRDVLYSILVWP